MALLDSGVHDLWLAEAKNGNPPSPRLVAELQYGLTVSWHHEKAFLGDRVRIIPGGKKRLICEEASRGSGKSTIVNFRRLYLVEYILPFLQRPGLGIRQENRNYVIFGRDQNHLKDEILTPLRNLLLERAPWLRTSTWDSIIEDTEDPDPEALREIGEMKSRGGQKWEAYRLDLANGVSFRTRTIKQTARSMHIFAGDMDDILEEKNVAESPRIKALIEGAIRPAIEPGGLFIIDGCLTGDSDVLMHDGVWKKIMDVAVGEQVWTTNEEGNYGPRAVLAKIPQGTKDVLCVKTDIGPLRATGNHPFLTSRNGRLEWVKAENLRVGDYVASARTMPGELHPWMDSEMAWFLGFMLGDGWLSDNGAIAIAISKDEVANQRIEEAWRHCLPFVPFQTVPFGGRMGGGGYIRGHSKETVVKLRELGFGGKAKTKRIPEWVFRLTPEVKIALLRGLADADGHKNLQCRDLEVIELANEPLVRDIRNLALTCGVKPGGVRLRERNIRVPSTGKIVNSRTATVSLNFSSAERREFTTLPGIGVQSRRDAIAVTALLGPNFRLARVQSITPDGHEQVYDLTVEGAKSFIANGLVVHNTPQSPGDLFDLCKDDANWEYGAHPAFDLDGSLEYAAKNRVWLGDDAFYALPVRDRASLWPARLTWEYLESERGNTRESELKWLREYMLERSPIDTALVHPEDIISAKDPTLSYHFSPQPGCHYGGGVDPSARKQDDAGFCVGYVLEGGIRVPATFRKLLADARLPEGEGEMSVVREVNGLAHQFNCTSWMVESNGFQGVVAPLARGLNSSIRFEKFQLGANKHTENGWLAIRTLFRSRLVRLPYKSEEDKAMTEDFLHQLRGIQYVGGRIVEDPKRKNDLVSAFFLFAKLTERAAAEYSVSAIPAPGPSASAGTLQRGPLGATAAPTGEFAGYERSRAGPTRQPPSPSAALDRVHRWMRR